MAIRMIEQRRHQGRITNTLVSDGSILYVFRGSIAQAQHEGARMLDTLAFACADEIRFTLGEDHGPDVVDIPLQRASLVWMDDTPHLFPGSLATASDIGKGYKRQWLYLKRTQREAERRAVDGFVRQYGGGIGEEHKS